MRALFVGTLLAFVVSLCFTPLAARLARRFDIVDWPDTRRKLHAAGVPLGGGGAVLLAVLAGTTALMVVPNGWQRTLLGDAEHLAGMLLSAAAVCALGLVDDRFNLRGRQKLLGQLAVVGLMMAFGLVIKGVTLFGGTVELGLLSFPFTAFWLLGAINAFNLLDGLDGLAAAIGLVLSVALTAMAYEAGHYGDAVLAMMLAGSLAGFLMYNAPPATIFLGDAGSMLIGLLLGALAMRSSLEGPATMALAAPMALLAIPIFDASMAVLRRTLTGRSVYTSDCGHLHHMLKRKGFSDRRIVLLVGTLSSVCAIGAWAGRYYQNEILALGGALAVLCTLVGARWFGHAEIRLLENRSRAFLESLIPAPSANGAQTNSITSRLQGNHDWQCLWTLLVDYAHRFDLHAVHLHINLPTEHEVYDAAWSKHHAGDATAAWSATVPLIAGAQVVGHLEIRGTRMDGRHTSCWMAELIEGLKPFELELIEQLETLIAAPRRHRQPSRDVRSDGLIIGKIQSHDPA